MTSKQSLLGRLPSQLEGALPVIDAEALCLNGKTWMPLAPGDKAPRPVQSWQFKEIKQPKNIRRYLRDRSVGNFLWTVENAAAPSYYIKELFIPKFLCASADGRRLWLSTYTGLARLDLPKPDAGAAP